MSSSRTDRSLAESPRVVRLRRGLDLPVPGPPAAVIEDGRAVTQVAFVAADIPDLRPSVLVELGESVRLGQPLVADRRRPGVVHTSPGSGRVAAIHRGARRALQSIVVDLDERQPDDLGADGPQPASDRPSAPAGLARDELVARLLACGLWTTLRTRPFGGVARPDEPPTALFVTAIDTRPLAPDPALVLADRRQDFSDGLAVLGRLLDGPVFLCTAPGADIPLGDPDRITPATFAGPHPAGLPGTHIHHLAPVGPDRRAWHVGYQDVAAIGRFVATGRLSVERVIALAGPHVRRPRLLRTRLGASLGELLAGELQDGTCRVVSGSLLDGRGARGALGFLGPQHVQVSVVGEGQARPVGPRRAWSIHSLWSRWSGRRGRALFDTARHGRRGPLLTLPSFDRVMPLDVLPGPLLRGLLAGDDEAVEALGGLELEEEDLALCAYLCPGKIAWGRLLRGFLMRREQQS